MSVSLTEYTARLANLRAWRASTRQQIEIAVDQFLQHTTGGTDMTLAEITSDQVSAWLQEREGACSPRTVANRRRDLLLVINAAVADSLRPGLGPVRQIKVPRRLPVAWTHSELVQLLRATLALDDTYFSRTGLPRGLFWRSLIRFKYDTALRLGDVLSTQVSSLNLGETPRVRCLVSKTNSELNKHLQPLTVRDLRLFLPPNTKRRNHVWEWKSHTTRLHEDFKHLVQSAGIRAGTTRWIRRSSASYLDRDHPGRAREHLGHRTSGLAESNYLDPDISGGDSLVPPELPDLG